MTAALSARRFYPPDKSVLVIKKEEAGGVVSCGIPYVFGTFRSVDDDLIPIDAFLKPAGIEVLVDEVVQIDPPRAKLVRPAVERRSNGKNSS